MPHPLSAFGLGLCAAICCFAEPDKPSPLPKPWETKLYVSQEAEYKVGGEAREFDEYLRLQSSYYADFRGLQDTVKYQKAKGGTYEYKWRELGDLGGKRLRQVKHYWSDPSVDADRHEYFSLVLVERFPEKYFPLWITFPYSEESPDGVIYRVDGREVLVLSKDYGSNLPMFKTHAWVWTDKGPMRIDVEHAIRRGIDKVAFRHNCHEYGLDWTALHFRSWCWPPGERGEQPKKPEVDEEINIWFQLQGHRLVVKRAQWRKSNVQDSKRATIRSKRWP